MDFQSELNNLKLEIKELKFQIRLLIENSTLNKFLLESNVTEEELNKIYKVLDRYRSLFDDHKEVEKSLFETEVLDIFNNEKDYHFCNSLTKLLAKEKRYEEIYKSFYCDTAIK